jgi:hypothetical protein
MTLLTLLFLAYAIGALVVAVQLVREIPDDERWGGAGWFAAVVVCLLWPVLAVTRP